MDDDTRYWLASDLADTKFQHNADKLLKLTKKAIGKNPRQFITDGLPAYKKSSKCSAKNQPHEAYSHPERHEQQQNGKAKR
jgi:hypothetical protein